ncbi:hypothetical protein PIB30_034962 [Stylosanthes scabra]|uniref:Uncharacterized protein n=1 Tax=Stylosanthes scabra TaxID=79078 RepID=A0ABU6YBC8_9FABA|nr:hypothetical protein [Stylosanthes scabra]
MEWMKKELASSRRRDTAKSVEKLSPQLTKVGVGLASGHAHEIPRGSLVIEEDMELYLLRVCTKLYLGYPRFEKHVYSSQEGKM